MDLQRVSVNSISLLQLNTFAQPFKKLNIVSYSILRLYDLEGLSSFHCLIFYIDSPADSVKVIIHRYNIEYVSGREIWNLILHSIRYGEKIVTR